MSEDNRTYLRRWTRASDPGGTEYVFPKGYSQLTGFGFFVVVVVLFFVLLLLFSIYGILESLSSCLTTVVPGRHLTSLQLIK